jgi:hypothetical protein
MRCLAARTWFALVFASGCLLASCSSSTQDPESTPLPLDAGETLEPLFEIPASLDAFDGIDHWLDHPWPSDMRLDSDRTLHLQGYPNPRIVPLLKTYIESMKGVLRGFSPAAAGYVRFTAPLDPSSLPSDPVQATRADSSVQLFDVDPSSPEKGTRKLLSLYWRKDDGAYYRSNTLAFMPALGYPLRGRTQHALVVTDQLRALSGGPVRASSKLRQVLGLDPTDGASEPLRQQWAQALQAVSESGIDPSHVVHLTVFTTSDPTAETAAVARNARTSQPTPAVDASSWKRTTGAADYTVYEAIYGPSPDYQVGKPPFAKLGDGGAFLLDFSGTPIKQREFSPRFALAIPSAFSCPPPASGYPVVMYAHGTGGDYRSFVDDGTAQALAKECLASMGVDQIMHASRLPSGGNWTPETLFFNFENPDAARTNPRQSAVDEVVRARLIREGGLQVPASVSSTGTSIPIDPQRVLFFGHSQGGINGPIFMAVDDGVRGGVLSGSGAVIGIPLLEKTKPAPSVAQLVKSILFNLSTAEYDELNYLHPGISLLQNIIDVGDPIHYAPLLVRHPMDGHAPKSIYQTEGVNPDGKGDSYTPPHSIEVQAVATGLPVMNPVIHPIAEMAWSGSQPVTIPLGGLQGNLASGQASGVLAQWPASQASDGHFVVFDIAAARAQAAAFCRNLADDPVGRIPAP